MKVYIAGKISDNPDYMEQFSEAEKMLKAEGHIVMNPTVLPPGFEHSEYLNINLSMIDVCDAVYFLKNWVDSIGANIEHRYAASRNKLLMFQGKMEFKMEP